MWLQTKSSRQSIPATVTATALEYTVVMATIFVTRKIPAVGIDTLKTAGHRVVVSEKEGVLTKSELLAALAAEPYDALITLLTDTIDEEVFAAAPSVRLVANYAVGYNNIALEAAKARGVVVTNTPDVLTDTVAEYTVALMLAITKRVPEGDRFVRAGRYDGWAPELLLGSDLKGKTLGIVGAGRIGAAVAKIAHYGFGMNISYTDRTPSLDPATVPAQYCATLEELLPVADVVSLHVPLVPETHHALDDRRLRLMKSTAYLINTSRGPVIDETALAQVLTEKAIAGAAIDVFENEPTVHPTLTGLDTVILTPHIASATKETRDKMSAMVADNVLAFFSGATPPHQVT